MNIYNSVASEYEFPIKNQDGGTTNMKEDIMQYIIQNAIDENKDETYMNKKLEELLK